MTMKTVEIAVEGATLAGTRAGAGPGIVLLHAGVADRRMWTSVQSRLADGFGTLAYDRRGFGNTVSTDAPFSHVDDLVAVLDHAGIDRATLIGCSRGGALAIDAALAHPDRIKALVLVASSLSGAPPPPAPTGPAAALLAELDAAETNGDLDRANEIESQIWLDGPLSPAGRVAGPARALFLDMNGIALRHAPLTGERTPPPAHDRLEQIAAPTLVLCGDFDWPHIQARSAMLAARIPGAQHIVMPGCAHLPSLEQPAQFLEAVSAFLQV